MNLFPNDRLFRAIAQTVFFGPVLGQHFVFRRKLPFPNQLTENSRRIDWGRKGIDRSLIDPSPDRRCSKGKTIRLR